MQATPQQRSNTGAYVAGGILIVIGVAALLANFGGGQFGLEALLIAVGGAFLVGYAMTRRYGYLVPGGILFGLGGGMLAASLTDTTDNGALAAIGLGVGFLLIYAIDLVVTGSALRWWPVIPGAVMVVIGSAANQANASNVMQVVRWSPVALIIIGILALFARGGRPKPEI